MRPGVFGVDDEVGGIQINAALEFDCSLLIASRELEVMSVKMVHLGIAWIEFARPSQLWLRRRRVPVIEKLDDAEGQMGFREIVIEFERFLSELAGLRKNFLWRNDA